MTVIPLDRPLRSLSEAKADHVAPYLTTPFYLVMIEPRHGKPYPVEMNWEAMINREATLQEVIECDTLFIHGQKIHVFRFVPGEKSQDATREFALLYARRLIEEGARADEVADGRFISAQLTNDEIEELFQC